MQPHASHSQHSTTDFYSWIATTPRIAASIVNTESALVQRSTASPPRPQMPTKTSKRGRHSDYATPSPREPDPRNKPQQLRHIFRIVRKILMLGIEGKTSLAEQQAPGALVQHGGTLAAAIVPPDVFARRGNRLRPAAFSIVSSVRQVRCSLSLSAISIMSPLSQRCMSFRQSRIHCQAGLFQQHRHRRLRKIIPQKFRRATRQQITR